MDSRLLELVIRPTGVDGLVLTDVADEQHAVVRSETMQERVHLLRARETRFIEHVQALSIGRWRVIVAARKMPLQRARRDAGLGELVSRPRRRREPFDVIALTFGGVANRGERRRLAGAGDAFERHDLIATRRISSTAARWLLD